LRLVLQSSALESPPASGRAPIRRAENYGFASARRRPRRRSF